MNSTWKCKFCEVEFTDLNQYQRGAHAINCLDNPKQKEITAKAKANARAVLIVPRIEFKQNCPCCEKEFIQTLTQNEIDREDYKIYCSLLCACTKNNKRATELREKRIKLAEQLPDASPEAKAIELRKLGLGLNDIANIIGKNRKHISKWVDGIKAIDPERQKKFDGLGPIISSKNRIIARLEREKRFIKEADELFEQYKDDSLFMLGLGLYWGEGSKTNKHFSISNADVGLLRQWITWVKKFVSECKLHYSVYGHEDVLPNEAFRYWASELDIDKDRINFIKSVPGSSKSKRPKRILPYGTFRIVMGEGGTEMHHKMMRWLEILRNM